MFMRTCMKRCPLKIDRVNANSLVFYLFPIFRVPHQSAAHRTGFNLALLDRDQDTRSVGLGQYNDSMVTN